MATTEVTPSYSLVRFKLARLESALMLYEEPQEARITIRLKPACISVPVQLLQNSSAKRLGARKWKQNNGLGFSGQPFCDIDQESLDAALMPIVEVVLCGHKLFTPLIVVKGI